MQNHNATNNCINNNHNIMNNNNNNIISITIRITNNNINT